MKSRFKFINIITTVVLALLPMLAGGQAVQAQEETINIGVVQYVEHEALDAVLKGFQETLDNSAYGDRIEWDINNASGDQSSLQ